MTPGCWADASLRSVLTTAENHEIETHTFCRMHVPDRLRSSSLPSIACRGAAANRCNYGEAIWLRTRRDHAEERRARATGIHKPRRVAWSPHPRAGPRCEGA